MYTISLFSLAFATCARSNIIQDRLITIAVLAESMAESESYAVGVRVVGLKLHRGIPYGINFDIASLPIPDIVHAVIK